MRRATVEEHPTDPKDQSSKNDRVGTGSSEAPFAECELIASYEGMHVLDFNFSVNELAVHFAVSCC